MVPLIATYVGREGSVPELIPEYSIRYYILRVRSRSGRYKTEHTVAFRQLLNCDRVVLGRIELNRGFGLEALRLWFVVGHCV